MDCPEVCLLEASQQEFSRSHHHSHHHRRHCRHHRHGHHQQENDHDGHQRLLHDHGQHAGGRPLPQRHPQNLERPAANLCSLIFQVE